MADITKTNETQSINIVGSDLSGNNTFPAAVNLNGSIQVSGEGTIGAPSGGIVSIQGVSGATLLPIKDAWAAAGDDGKMFTVTTMNLSLSATLTTEQALFLIDNPTGSGKSVKIKFLKLGTPIGGGNSFAYTSYRAPTILVNGTVVTPDGGRTSGQNTKVANYYKLPTWTTGTGIAHSYHKTAGNTSELVLDKGFALIVDPGNKLLFTVTPSSTSLSTYLTIDLKEE